MRPYLTVIPAFLLAVSVSGHNSVTEMSERFISTFADSKISADVVLRDFTPRCTGTEWERNDVEFNRKTRRMTGVKFRHLRTSLGPCAFSKSAESAAVEACSSWSVEFRGVILETGRREVTKGVAHVGAVRENGQWRLCTSEWENAK